jgi:hypothetical protein
LYSYDERALVKSTSQLLEGFRAQRERLPALRTLKIGIARRLMNRPGNFEQRDRPARDTPMDQYTREKVT